MQHLSVKTLTLVGQRPSLYVDRKTLFRKPPKYTSRELHGNFTGLHGMRVLKRSSFGLNLLHGNFTGTSRNFTECGFWKKRHLVDHFVEPNNETTVYYFCGGGVYINLRIYIQVARMPRIIHKGTGRIWGRRFYVKMSLCVDGLAKLRWLGWLDELTWRTLQIQVSRVPQKTTTKPFKKRTLIRF